MGASKSERRASYTPMPYIGRHWIYSESCYTENELNQRQSILSTRAASGIDPEYLANPNSWFGADDQALVNHYENSWFFSSAYRPRHTVRRVDFPVRINHQRLHWPALYNLMQMVGDYLFCRNYDLPQEYLNSPMNFFFLDLNFILRGLSQNSDVNQVKEQLALVNRYVRSVETQITSNAGSDRSFLANFRSVIDDRIEPQLTHRIESQLLKERLGKLAKTVRQVSSERNRILHFALNINPVNSHSYDFSTELVGASAAYPTQAAKECADSASKEIATTVPAILQLTAKQLKECEHFKLIAMTDDILDHYSAAMSDLNELERFQKVIFQITDLLDQAGEVYTVLQFENQMKSLLQQMESFIDTSSLHIESIINANTQEYTKAIGAQQDLSFWQTSEKEKLKTFIKNHDTLSQFPSTTAELRTSVKELNGQVSDIIGHLNQPKTKRNTFEGLTKQAKALNQLMNSMHDWIKIQYEKKGLPAPKAPTDLKCLLAPAKLSSQTSIMPAVVLKHAQRAPKSAFFQQHLALADNNSLSPLVYSQCESRQTNLGFLGLFLLIPIAMILLYLLLNRNKKKEAAPVRGEENGPCGGLLVMW